MIISALEKSEVFGPIHASLFAQIDEGRIEAVTSEITLAECLVKPFVDKDILAVETYISFLGGQPGLSVIPISQQILLSAARLRAETKLKLPDAIHVGTAKLAGCSAYVTNDRGIKATAGLRIILWDKLSETDYSLHEDGDDIV